MTAPTRCRNRAQSGWGTPRLLLLYGLVAVVSHAAEPAATIALWPEGVPGGRTNGGREVVTEGAISNVHRPSLLAYPAASAKANGTAVIICPGGAYRTLALQHEGYTVARWFNERGVTAFILKYRLKEYGQPAPLQDVTRAVRLVRSRSTEWGVQPNRIGLLGGSAGGHVAASAGTLYDHALAKTGAALDAVSARPDFMILLYPVITMDAAYAASRSRASLLGEMPAPELVELYSLERQVTEATPPTFILHTQADELVPVRNGVEFFTALTRAGVAAELHTYERGPHGIALQRGHGPASDWPELAEDWLRLHGWIASPRQLSAAP